MDFYNNTQKMIAKFIKPENYAYLNHLSIRDRLILILLAVSIIPLSLMGVISYHISKAAIADKISQYSLRELTQVTNNLDLSLKKYEDFSTQMISSREINQSLAECVNNGSLDFLALNQRFKKIFDDSAIASENGTSILFNSLKNDQHYQTGSGYILADQFRKTVDFRKTLAAKGKIHWFYLKGNIGLSRLVGDLNSLQPIGVVSVFFNSAGLDKVINYTLYNESSDSSEKTILKHPYSMIITKDGIVVASPFQDDWGKNISQLVRDHTIMKKLADLGEESGKFSERVKNKNVLMTVNPIPAKEWYLLSVAPNSYLYAESTMVGLWALGLGIIISFIVVIISLMVALGISQPLQQVMIAMKQAENGDLSANVKLDSQDELGQLGRSFNRMITQIQMLISDTKNLVSEVLKRSQVLEESSAQSSQTAEAVATATAEISRGTMEQTQEAEKATQKMDDLAKRIEAVVSQSTEMEQITETVRKMGLQSKTMIQQLTQNVNETDDITNTAVKDIQELSSSAEKIKSLTEAITGIAEQTNLLALNAAIEAARAGEYGSGFAVVAEEINHLATQSRETAKTINNILQEIETKSITSTQTVSKAHQIVTEQLATVEEAKKSFDQIIDAMNNVVHRLSDVNENIKKINEVKEETISFITNIGAISEETAASSEEVSASAQEQTAIAEQVSSLAVDLLKISDQLASSVTKFKISIS
jgi:methyl-accepting chemotaxis protein